MAKRTITNLLMLFILIICCAFILYVNLFYKNDRQKLNGNNFKQAVTQTLKASDIIHTEIQSISNASKTNQAISKITDGIHSQLDSFNSYKKTVEGNNIEENKNDSTDELQNIYAGSFLITAYTWTGNTMANGEYPYVGCAASSDLPIGTVIYIEGIGTYIIKDVCPAPGVIDLYMDTYNECINFGRRTANVYIIQNGVIK